MEIDLEFELMTIIEAEEARLCRPYASGPGLIVVNLEEATDEEDELALLIAENGLAADVWVDVFRALPPMLAVVVHGEEGAAVDWLTTLERMPADALVWLDHLPSVIDALYFRRDLEDGSDSLLPPSFETLDWTPPA